MATFEFIILESKGAVGIITLNRPKMLNALSFGVFREIAAAIDDLEADDRIGCIVFAGSGKAVAAGAELEGPAPTSRRCSRKASSTWLPAIFPQSAATASRDAASRPLPRSPAMHSAAAAS